MGLRFSNFGKALIGSAPSGTAGLSFSVEAGKGLLYPALGVGDYFYGVFKDASGNREIVKVEARSTDAMTIAVGGRGLDGTTARTWAAGDYFVAGLVNIAMEESLANPNLIALGALASAADKLPYFTGSGAADVTTLAPFIRTLLDDTTAATALTTLGVSAFVQTLLNDVDAATARATLGVSYGPAFKARSAANQSVTSGIDTKVTLGTEVFDTASCFASNRFTPNVAGYYFFSGGVRINATNLTVAACYIYKNGTADTTGNLNYMDPAGLPRKVVVSGLVSMNGTTDYVELYANGVGTTPIFEYSTAANAASFSGLLVRPT